MRLFGRSRRVSRSAPTYSNASVVFLDLTAGSKEFISPPEPDACRRAYERRTARGAVDHAIWAVGLGASAGGG